VAVPPLYFDHDVSAIISRSLRRSSYDVVTASEIGLTRAGDHEQVTAAAELNRVLISYNAKDFRLLHDAWRRWSDLWGVGRSHAGILIILQSPAWSAARAVREIIQFFEFEVTIENELYEWWRDSRQWERRVQRNTVPKQSP